MHRCSLPPVLTGISLFLAASLWPFAVLSSQTSVDGTQESPLRGPPTPSEIRSIDSVFSRLDNSRSPGCAMGVLQDGHLTFARGYGMANLDHGIAITPRTIFRTGSVAKQFTAAVVVLLAREGAFSLDEDIRVHFPELPDYGSTITIRHLLHHTSGIRDYLELMSMRGLGTEAKYWEDDVVEILARQRGLNFNPGERFLYSNSGYLLLSRLIERTTGQTLRQQADRLIFRPLAMERSHYHDNHHDIVPDRATGYGLGPGNRFVIDQTTLDIIGDGGVFTSIEDIALWMANFWDLNVGGESWLATMEQRGVLNSGEIIDYAMGLRHGSQGGIPYVGHGGAFVGYRAATLRYPEERLAVMVLCNYALTDPMAMAMDVSGVLLSDKMEPPEESAEGPARPAAPEPAAPLSREEEDEYLGTFYSDEVDATLRIFRGEEGLLLDVNGAWDIPLLPAAPDRLQARYLSLRFKRENGEVTGFMAGSGRAGGVEFVRRN